MISWSIPKASLAGIAIFVLGDGLYLAFSQYELLRLLLLGTPGFAAFAAAYWAPRWKMAVGMSMAIFGAALGELAARVYEYFGGHVDHIGGLAATLIMLFAYYSAASVLGSMAGVFLSKSQSAIADNKSD